MTNQNLAYRLIALALALLIGTTSMGFSIGLHYCQGDLKSISLLGESSSCHDTAKKQCSNHPQKGVMTAEEEANCCKNAPIFLQNDDDKQIAQHQVEASDLQHNWISPVVLGSRTLNNFVYNDADFEHYKPPLIRQDRPILFESFLL